MAAVLSTQLPLETSSLPYASKKDSLPNNSISEINYLQRSIENISEKTESDHIFTGRTHKTIAIAVGVLFAAVVIAAVVVTAIFSPASIPIAALGAFIVTPTIQNFISTRLIVSESSFANAQQCQDIRSQRDKLPKTQDAFLSILASKGIQLADIQDERIQANPFLLAPVLAHYNYWHDQAVKLQTASKNARIEQAEYSGKFPGENQETRATNISNIRLNSIACHEHSLMAKTNAAFYLGILRNPGFCKEVSEIMQFGTTIDIGSDSERSRIILGERALASRFSPNEDYLLQMHHSDSSVETLTRCQVKQLSEAELSAKLFA